MEYKLHDIVLLKKYPKPRYGQEALLIGDVYGVIIGFVDNNIKVYVKKEEKIYRYPSDTVRLEKVHRFTGDKPKEVTLKFKAVYWNGQCYLKIDKDRVAKLEITEIVPENVLELKDMEIPKAETVTYEPILKPITTGNDWGYNTGYFETGVDFSAGDLYWPTIEQIEEVRDYNQEPF